MKTLRPYQEELVSGFESAIARGQRRVMMQSPTGSGKTVTLSEIARRYAISDKRVLVLSHRRELVKQAAATLGAMSGLPVGIIQGSQKPDYRIALQSGSVGSIMNRLPNIQAPSLIITDEGHHSAAASYRKIYDYFPRADNLAVSATPIRADGRGFDDLFDVMLLGPSVKSLIMAGNLSRYKLYADEAAMKVDGVKKIGGEYSAKQLAEANDEVELSGGIVKSYLRHCPGKRCLVFAINIQHSQQIAAAYRDAGIAALHVDAETPEEIRDGAIAAFAKGEIKVISNVGLFTEGTDIPAIEACQIARPTASLALWLQMVGRALRPCEGKGDAIIIDHTSNYVRHGLPCASRHWTLDGVHTIKPASLARDALTGEVIEKLLPLDFGGKPITEKPVELVEIDLNPLQKWLPIYTDLLQEMQESGKKTGWLISQLQSKKAPLEIFEQVEAEFGYQKGWAGLVYRATLSREKASKNKAQPYRKKAPKKVPSLFDLLPV
jgi:superfamily II DNA or RNA helicase